MKNLNFFKGLLLPKTTQVPFSTKIENDVYFPFKLRHFRKSKMIWFAFEQDAITARAAAACSTEMKINLVEKRKKCSQNILKRAAIYKKKQYKTTNNKIVTKK